jgi:hypothetical protein
VAATVAGALGALGAAFIIFSYKFGGVPIVVMPLVFGGAPVVNVLYSMSVHPPKNPPSAMFYLGLALAAAGAGLVLYYRPQS